MMHPCQTVELPNRFDIGRHKKSDIFGVEVTTSPIPEANRMFTLPTRVPKNVELNNDERGARYRNRLKVDLYCNMQGQ